MPKKTALQKKIGKLLHEGDLCYIQNNDYEQYGLVRNDVVVIFGSRAIPIDEDDPYLQRVFFGVAKVDAEAGDISYDTGLIIIDPNALRKVTKKKQDEWEEKREAKLEALQEKMEADATVN